MLVSKEGAGSGESVHSTWWVTLWRAFRGSIVSESGAAEKNNLSSGGHTNCKFYKWISSLDFPGGPLIENLPANAGSMGSDPWSGRIPCAVRQISPSTAIAESMCCKYWTLLALEPMLCNKRSPCREKPRQCNWRVTPHLLQLEKAYAQQWRPSTTKN